MIEKITIKDVATFDNNKGVDIENLKKVNFFFGYNGTGKSTIAKFLHNLSLDVPEQSEDFKNCSQIGYDSVKHQILVFDDVFVENNFIRNNILKGIFSLNQMNATIDTLIKDEEEIIKEKEKYITSKNGLIEKLKSDEISKETNLKDSCFNVRSSFTSFNKITLDHSRNKANHLNELKCVQIPIQNIPIMESLSEVYQQLYEREITKVGEIINASRYREIRHTERDLCRLLSEVIVGNEDVDIAALIKATDSRAWVEQGVDLLKQTNKICPFCQNETIDEILISQFDEFFDVAYKNKIAKIKVLKEQYNTSCNSLLEDISNIQNIYNPDSIASNLLIDLRSIFDRNLRIIDDKLLKPNERKKIVSLEESRTRISLLNEKIKNNDSDFDGLAEKKRELIDDIWKYMTLECNTSIKEFDLRVIKYDKINILATELNSLREEEILSSKQKIEEWRSRTVNTRDAIDNINRILKTSGFEGFQIEEKEKVNNISQYYLKRNNTTSTESVFKSLSEGEKNFISFLYFYQLCLGTDNIEINGSKKKIIVIDDPVSSLDSHVLFIVSTLIHQLIWRKGEDKPNRKLLRSERIDQIFILTHNLYFYKEVSFNKRPTCTDYWHYIVSKNNNITEIIGDYNKTISDDYSLLWDTIKAIKTKKPSNSSENIAISNLMRRIIDSYVSFIGLGKDSWGAVLNDDMNDPQYIIKCAFLSSLNDDSHGIKPHDSLFYQKIITEQPQMLFSVFKDIFNTIGVDHYNMMMGVDPENEPAL